MNSCIYECDIMHYRKTPQTHKFTHRIFMFYLDLDELNDLQKRTVLISRNRKNIYSFFDNDHVSLNGKGIKENITEYLKSKGVDLNGGKIKLLTNLRTFGYVFNPVSFYFCFNAEERPVCVVVEIGNTFRELKPFFIGAECLQGDRFQTQQTKYFYISPFVDLDIPLDFNLKVPGERLDIKIDDIKDGQKFLYTTMAGPRKELTFANLLRYTFMFPFVTLKVIFLIHWHAAILHFIKKVPYHRKEDNPHLQKEVFRVWCKS